MSDNRFAGTDRYVATEDLTTAVNAAVTLGRPILIKGEPGTGKTQLAEEIARGLERPLLEWHIKSTTKAQQGLYEYDAVSRLRDSQLGDEKVKDIGTISRYFYVVTRAYTDQGRNFEKKSGGMNVAVLINSTNLFEPVWSNIDMNMAMCLNDDTEYHVLYKTK